jgi:hypothetical protein
MTKITIIPEVEQRVSHLPNNLKKSFLDAIKDLEQNNVQTAPRISDDTFCFEKKVTGMGCMAIYFKTETDGLNLNFKIIDFQTPEDIQEEKRKARIAFIRGNINNNTDWFKLASHSKLIGTAIGTLFIILIILGQIINFPKQIKPYLRDLPENDNSSIKFNS